MTIQYASETHLVTVTTDNVHQHVPVLLGHLHLVPFCIHFLPCFLHVHHRLIAVGAGIQPKSPGWMSQSSRLRPKPRSVTESGTLSSLLTLALQTSNPSPPIYTMYTCTNVNTPTPTPLTTTLTHIACTYATSQPSPTHCICVHTTPQPPPLHTLQTLTHVTLPPPTTTPTQAFCEGNQWPLDYCKQNIFRIYLPILKTLLEASSGGKEQKTWSE